MFLLCQKTSALKQFSFHAVTSPIVCFICLTAFESSAIMVVVGDWVIIERAFIIKTGCSRIFRNLCELNGTKDVEELRNLNILSYENENAHKNHVRRHLLSR